MMKCPRGWSSLSEANGPNSLWGRVPRWLTTACDLRVVRTHGRGARRWGSKGNKRGGC
jgi:hypothetical protein